MWLPDRRRSTTSPAWFRQEATTIVTFSGSSRPVVRLMTALLMVDSSSVCPATSFVLDGAPCQAALHGAPASCFLVLHGAIRVVATPYRPAPRAGVATLGAETGRAMGLPEDVV